MKKVNKTFLQRKGRHNRHHNLPKSRGGTDEEINLFRFDENRHAAFHLLFGDKTFSEIAMILLRAERMKKRIRPYTIITA